MKRLVMTALLIVAGFTLAAGGKSDDTPAYGEGRGEGISRGLGEGSGNGYGRGNGNGPGNAENGAGNGYSDNFTAEIHGLLADVDPSGLSAAEKEGLLLMREEEKLARDVYAELYDVWNFPIFANIGRSEQQHMDAVKYLLDAYGLDDPVKSDERGVFTSPELQTLYNELVAQGRKSLVEALKTGARIEDLDIADLQRGLEATDNEDIAILYQNLMKGSRNHMRSFVRLLEREDETYAANYISPEYLDKILKYNPEIAPITDPAYSL